MKNTWNWRKGSFKTLAYSVRRMICKSILSNDMQKQSCHVSIVESISQNFLGNHSVKMYTKAIVDVSSKPTIKTPRAVLEACSNVLQKEKVSQIFQVFSIFIKAFSFSNNLSYHLRRSLKVFFFFFFFHESFKFDNPRKLILLNSINI